MKLIVTIDVEEDNWARYSATENPVENIERIPDLQKLFDEFGVKPTYLVTYPVATNPRSLEILKRILDDGKCEIGMHCHPCNTPPYDEREEIHERDTMLCNLDKELVHLKLSRLHETICRNFGVVPMSFRAGRWGLGPGVVHSIGRLGYRVDTSVTPFMSWEDCQGPDFSHWEPERCRFKAEEFGHMDGNEAPLEVPVTIGFLQPHFRSCSRVLKSIEKPLLKKLHMTGILGRLRLVNKVWLSPELTGPELMIKLARRIEKKGYSCLNMTFHSTSLLNGFSPFVKTREDEHRFLKTIRTFLTFARAAGWESTTLSQFEAAC